MEVWIVSLRKSKEVREIPKAFPVAHCLILKEALGPAVRNPPQAGDGIVPFVWLEKGFPISRGLSSLRAKCPEPWPFGADREAAQSRHAVGRKSLGDL